MTGMSTASLSRETGRARVIPCTGIGLAWFCESETNSPDSVTAMGRRVHSETQ